MREGERQVSPTLDGIRRDHVARYEFAARHLQAGSRVIDFACGVGYGCRILAEAGHHAIGYDVDPEAVSYARAHYAHENCVFVEADGNAPPALDAADAAICFETVEHLEDPRPLLKVLRASTATLLVSVPNEAVMPWQIDERTVTAFHFRHYTRHQFDVLLRSCGWQVCEWHGQAGPESGVEPGVDGRTLVAVARAANLPDFDCWPEGKHIAILGLGPSVRAYSDVVKRMGGRRAYCDETWAINALGNVFACDRVFHMDDVRVQEIRAAAAPESNIAAMLRELRSHAGPIITSRTHPEYPGFTEFPLAEVVNRFPTAYFNSTAAYAVAYAIYMGARKISLFGIDFTYPNAHDAEKGRACVEFWLGVAAALGIELAMPKTTSLMDAYASPRERFYGFDCVDLAFRREDGRIVIDMTERAKLPSAAEIEDRYDHSRHPNAIVEAAQG